MCAALSSAINWNVTSSPSAVKYKLYTAQADRRNLPEKKSGTQLNHDISVYVAKGLAQLHTLHHRIWSFESQSWRRQRQAIIIRFGTK